MFYSKLSLPASAEALATERDFELAGYVFEAKPEEMRHPRLVNIGLIQNQIVLPTTAPILQQVCGSSNYKCIPQQGSPWKKEMHEGGKLSAFLKCYVPKICWVKL